MKVITGDEFGLIKLISTQSKQVLDQYGKIDSSKSINNIFINNKIKLSENNNNSELEHEENEQKEELNLFVSSIKENYILNWDNKKIISSYKNENPNTSFISSTIKFKSTNNNTIFINGTSDDKINLVSFSNENKFINSSTYWPVDNSNKFLKIKLRGISNSLYNNNENVYCLYQNTPIVLYNIEQQKIEFKGKNLPHDELGLRIPIHDTDVIEVSNNPRLNYVSTANGEIRFYDKKASPKPSLNKKVTKSKINKIDITEDNNYLFVGDNQGYCAMLDIRKSLHPCKTFKGNSGSIKSLVNIEKKNNLIVAGYDRYVKWYDYKSGNNDKMFIKNKINCMTLVGFEIEKKADLEEEESEIDDSDLLDEEDEEDNEEEDSKDKNEKKKINTKNKKKTENDKKELGDNNKKGKEEEKNNDEEDDEDNSKDDEEGEKGEEGEEEGDGGNGEEGDEGHGEEGEKGDNEDNGKEGELDAQINDVDNKEVEKEGKEGNGDVNNKEVKGENNEKNKEEEEKVKK